MREQSLFNIDDMKFLALRLTCLTRLLQGGLSPHKFSIWACYVSVTITLG